ncbi:hypothetical protein Tco_1415130 [Tanacetum coccineum]
MISFSNNIPKAHVKDPEVPNELIDILNNSSLESDDEIEDISSDDQRSEADDMEKIEKTEKPTTPLISSSLTVSSTENGNQ